MNIFTAHDTVPLIYPGLGQPCFSISLRCSTGTIT